VSTQEPEPSADHAAKIRRMAHAIRVLAIDAVEEANSGHPGMPMGMADVATVLFTELLKFDPDAPDWPDRDRFILSAGHGSMLLYALLHLLGYPRPTMDDIRRFRQLHSPCAGHPESHELAGVEVTTGPLGQGLAMAVGMAIAEAHLAATFGRELVDHHSWVIAGDGCLMEGVSHEAAGLAGHLGLGRLNVLWDDNGISIDGPVGLASSEDVPARFAAAGWHVIQCDGHDPGDIRRALGEARDDPRPSLVRCRTIIGYGAPTKAGTEKTHGSPLGAAEAAGARAALGWTHPPFEIPEDLLLAWRAAGERGKGLRSAWQERLATHAEAEEFQRRMAGDLPPVSLDALKARLIAEAKPVATRKASELVLEAVNAEVPETIGGSADLTGSNNTKTSGLGLLTSEAPGGRYIHYGIREFGMAAAMNGMALHGGIIPYGGTFLVFSDYSRPAIRLGALQGARVIHVLTHDSIGLGEDGPTHQPIEHLAALRAIPNLAVYRPADAIETAECWELALADRNRPSVLALSRQNLPPVRTEAGDNRCAAGAYRLKAAEAPRRVVLVATGSEVHVALAAAALLEAERLGSDVVSMPSWERFAAQSRAAQLELLPAGVLKVSVEAGATFGWQRWVDLAIGLDRFGASAPGDVLMAHFGFTAAHVAEQVRAALASERPGQAQEGS
jgi:transketolase